MGFFYRKQVPPTAETMLMRAVRLASKVMSQKTKTVMMLKLSGVEGNWMRIFCGLVITTHPFHITPSYLIYLKIMIRAALNIFRSQWS